MNGYDRGIDKGLFGTDDAIEGGKSFAAGVIEGGDQEHAAAGDKAGEDRGCED